MKLERYYRALGITGNEDKVFIKNINIKNDLIIIFANSSINF